MVGRARGSVEVGGLANVGTSLRGDVEAAAKMAGLTARPGGPGAGRSDDSSFIDQKMPSLHFFTGFHDDYHRRATIGSKLTQPALPASRRWHWSSRRASRRGTTGHSSRSVKIAAISTRGPLGHSHRRGADSGQRRLRRAEFAAVGVRRSRIQQLAADGNPLAAWLLPLIESPAALDRYIAACQIGITLSSLVLGAYAQRTIAVWLTPAVCRLSAGLQEVAAAIDVGRRRAFCADRRAGDLRGADSEVARAPVPHPDRALHADADAAVALALQALHQVAQRDGPAVPAAARRHPHEAHRHIHSPDEIELLIAESRDGGLLEPDEHRRLQRALRLNLRQAKQLMVPRRQIAAIDINTPLERSRWRSSRRARTRGCPSIATRSTTSSACCTRRISCGGGSAVRPEATLASLVRPIASVHESVTVDRVLRRAARAATRTRRSSWTSSAAPPAC